MSVNNHNCWSTCITIAVTLIYLLLKIIPPSLAVFPFLLDIQYVSNESMNKILITLALQCVCMFSHKVVSNYFATPWTFATLPGSSVHGISQARILE